MSIYDNIKELCDKKKMTIMELEKRAGISNGIVGGWRSGSPNVDNLVKVATVLGVTVNRLLRGVTWIEEDKA